MMSREKWEENGKDFILQFYSFAFEVLYSEEKCQKHTFRKEVFKEAESFLALPGSLKIEYFFFERVKVGLGKEKAQAIQPGLLF